MPPNVAQMSKLIIVVTALFGWRVFSQRLALMWMASRCVWSDGSSNSTVLDPAKRKIRNAAVATDKKLAELQKKKSE